MTKYHQARCRDVAMLKKNNPKKLADQVKSKITNRIIICATLLFFVFIINAFYDLYSNFRELKNTITSTSKDLEGFIISQTLIDNPVAIYSQLNKMSNKNIKFSWISNKEFNRNIDFTYNKIMFISYKDWVYYYKVVSIGKRNIGVLKISGSIFLISDIINTFFTRTIILLILCLSMFLILFPLSKKIPNDLFVFPIKNLLELIKNKNTVDINLDERNVSVEIKELVSMIIELVEKEKKESETKAVSLLSEQVLHDIKSPLSVLEMTLTDVKNHLPEHEYSILSEVITRVRDITNNLFSRYRESIYHSIDDNSSTGLIAQNELQNENGNISRNIILASIVETLASEKRQEWKENPCLITVTVNDDASLLWVYVSPTELKTVLSNILNNSYESLLNEREIWIKIRTENLFLCVEIQDHGIGIPENMLNAVKTGTSLKHAGKGIGLSSSLDYMKNIDGDLKIESKVNNGTIVKLLFPVAPTPAWFSDYILIDRESLIVVLDDDSSIHALLKRRFLENDIQSLHFDLVNDFLEHDLNKIDPSKLIFLIDYDLHNVETNGINIIKALNNHSQRYLMTSHYDKHFIQESCNNLKCFLLPKIFINNISFKFNYG